MEYLERLCKIIERQLEKAIDVLESEGGKKLPKDDAEYIDYLTHTLKSIKTIMAMEGYGSSERRGRDRMGRYTSRDGDEYSMGYDDRSMHGDDPRETIRRMMEHSGDERVKRALRTAMQSI
jgi:hypothetical protein